MLCSRPGLIVTRCTAVGTQQYLQIALLLICELSVVQSHLVERMVVLSVMTLIKHLHTQTDSRLKLWQRIRK